MNALATAAVLAPLLMFPFPRLSAEEGAEFTIGPGWKLLWHDEFEGEQLDTTKWSRCVRGTPDWQNTQSDDPSLLELREGVLRLRGVENESGDDPAPYLTAAISTEGKFAFCYGKIVIRARYKCAQGAWPAIWMLGNEHGWPKGGEIDLMEHLNFEDRIFQTVHSAYTVEEKQTSNPPSGTTTAIEDREGWHTYGVEWHEDRLDFTIDGRRTHSYPRLPEKGEAQWPFAQPFYLLFSMQIGGGWVNQSGPTKPEDYPAWLEIDWVRVFEAVGKAGVKRRSGGIEQTNP